MCYELSEIMQKCVKTIQVNLDMDTHKSVTVGTLDVFKFNVRNYSKTTNPIKVSKRHESYQFISKNTSLFIRQ